MINSETVFLGKVFGKHECGRYHDVYGNLSIHNDLVNHSSLKRLINMCRSLKSLSRDGRPNQKFRFGKHTIKYENCGHYNKHKLTIRGNAFIIRFREWCKSRDDVHYHEIKLHDNVSIFRFALNHHMDTSRFSNWISGVPNDVSGHVKVLEKLVEEADKKIASFNEEIARIQFEVNAINSEKKRLVCDLQSIQASKLIQKRDIAKEFAKSLEEKGLTLDFDLNKLAALIHEK